LCCQATSDSPLLVGIVVADRDVLDAVTVASIGVFSDEIDIGKEVKLGDGFMEKIGSPAGASSFTTSILTMPIARTVSANKVQAIKRSSLGGSTKRLKNVVTAPKRATYASTASVRKAQRPVIRTIEKLATRNVQVLLPRLCALCFIIALTSQCSVAGTKKVSTLHVVYDTNHENVTVTSITEGNTASFPHPQTSGGHRNGPPLAAI
jgi:hypothetical protein